MKAKVKILWIDGDADFLETHKAILESRGYDVLTASSGREGLECVRSEMPDLVILDLMMEKHDAGFLFCKTMKTDPLFKRIPILMVTGAAASTGCRFTQEQDGYWMKTNDFLDKPVTPEVLLDRIDKLLQPTKE